MVYSTILPIIKFLNALIAKCDNEFISYLKKKLFFNNDKFEILIYFLMKQEKNLENENISLNHEIILNSLFIIDQIFIDDLKIEKHLNFGSWTMPNNNPLQPS